MRYSLTEKLKFEKDPQIEVGGKVITVKSDAMTVLKLLDAINNKEPMESALYAYDVIFSEKDKKTIEGLGLKFDDFALLLKTAMALATGEDPDADQQGE